MYFVVIFFLELDVEKLQKPLTGSGGNISRRSPPLRKSSSILPQERNLKETFLAASPILIKLVELVSSILPLRRNLKGTFRAASAILIKLVELVRSIVPMIFFLAT